MDATALSPQLHSIRQQLDENSERAKQLCSGLSDERLVQRPAAGGWSVAECVEHLTLTTKEYLQLADAAFVNAPRSQGPFGQDWMGKVLAWTLEPPYKMKVATLPAFVPVNLNGKSVLPSFLDSQQELQRKLSQSEGLALDNIKVQSSFNEKVRYNLLSFFVILATHQRRHLWQAEQVKKSF